MVNKLLLPQEIETFYIIPALRRQIAFFLKEKGLKQKDIATILMVNTAAISQYTSDKRGNNITFKEPVLAEIKLSANNITNQFTYLRETQRLLQVIRHTNTLCEIHKQFSFVPDNCVPEDIGCHEMTGGCL